MEEKLRQIRLRPRLASAADMLRGFGVVADIGCDHGRLICALLQRSPGMRGIASDIGEAPLKRAILLAERIGVSDRISFRLGDGLSVLREGEADAVALLGMGGMVMTQMLSNCNIPLAGARLAVFQPMRGVPDIRRYLYENRYRIVSDRIVRDAGRLYQVFSAAPLPDGAAVSLPDGWPEDCFELGYMTYRSKDPLLPALARQMLAQHEKRLLTAGGTRGAALLQNKANDMRAILRLLGEEI